MLTKSELLERLTNFLFDEGVTDADELADSFVEQLDEDGAFLDDEDEADDE